MDQINIGTRTETHPVTQIRDEEKVENSTRVEYFRKVVPDENNPEHYFYEFLGVTESEGGFFEIRNSTWEEIGQVANLDSLQTFDQISSDFFQLEESWTSISTYLPADLADPVPLISSDGYDLFAFDTSGVMLGEINVWQSSGQWDMGGYSYEEYDYNYNFRDPNTGDRIAEAGGRKKYVIDENDNQVLDESGVRSSYKVEKPADDAEDAVLEAWEENNPNNDILFDWADIEFVEMGTNTWQSHENFAREQQTWGLTLVRK